MYPVDLYKIEAALQDLANQALAQSSCATQALFQEFLDHNELGLALLVICDDLLERDAHVLAPSWIDAVAKLQAQMGMHDASFAELISVAESHGRHTR